MTAFITIVATCICMLNFSSALRENLLHKELHFPAVKRQKGISSLAY